MLTPQENFWSSDFGDHYNQRNTFSNEEFNSLYHKRYGLTRSDMNQRFLADLPIETICEVGCNIGNQLAILQASGYNNLTGIDINKNAITVAQERLPSANIVEGSIFNLPFSDNQFDLVFTSGVLIHIQPTDLSKAMLEICRVSQRYIWGFEYYAPTSEEIEYRGVKDRLWRGDFAARYQKSCPGLTITKQEQFTYKDNATLSDAMFLLEK